MFVGLVFYSFLECLFALARRTAQELGMTKLPEHESQELRMKLSQKLELLLRGESVS